MSYLTTETILQGEPLLAHLLKTCFKDMLQQCLTGYRKDHPPFTSSTESLSLDCVINLINKGFLKAMRPYMSATLHVISKLCILFPENSLKVNTI